jgi:hypothetical protein
MKPTFAVIGGHADVPVRACRARRGERRGLAARTFRQRLPGFAVRVLDGDGNVVTGGRTLLETVRDPYD